MAATRSGWPATGSCSRVSRGSRASPGSSADAPTPPGAAAFAGALKILLPFEGTVDLAAERARLEREIEKRVRDLGNVEAKLANESFVARAPAPVVAKQRERAAELGRAVGRLRDQVERLAGAG